MNEDNQPLPSLDFDNEHKRERQVEDALVKASQGSLLERLNAIRGAVESLRIDRDRLAMALEDAQLQNRMLEQAVNQAFEEKEALEARLKIVKLAKSLDDSGEGKTELKLKINDLVREIDKALAMLTA